MTTFLQRPDVIPTKKLGSRPCDHCGATRRSLTRGFRSRHPASQFRTTHVPLQRRFRQTSADIKARLTSLLHALSPISSPRCHFPSSPSRRRLAWPASRLSASLRSKRRIPLLCRYVPCYFVKSVLSAYRLALQCCSLSRRLQYVALCYNATITQLLTWMPSTSVACI